MPIALGCAGGQPHPSPQAGLRCSRERREIILLFHQDPAFFVNMDERSLHLGSIRKENKSLSVSF